MADFSHESALWPHYPLIAGVDEVGRGPLAGPVVAAAVVFPAHVKLSPPLSQLTDSKKLSPRQREACFQAIQEQALDYSLGVVSHHIIDRINILQATYVAMWRAVSGLNQVDCLLIDGRDTLKYWDGPQEAIVKGDAASFSIAAASVLAKVYRDKLMTHYDTQYPAYGFASHKGYPTVKHRQAVENKGLTPIHRHSFCQKLKVAS